MDLESMHVLRTCANGYQIICCHGTCDLVAIGKGMLSILLLPVLIWRVGAIKLTFQLALLSNYIPWTQKYA